MSCTADKDEQASQHREKTRSEARIVVTSTLPLWESIAEEVIVALSARASQDVGHYTQARKAIAGCLGCGVDLCFRRALGDMNARFLALGFSFASRFLGDELLLDFVGV